jgi:hypothetical protein
LSVEGFRRVLRLWLEWGKRGEVLSWMTRLKLASQLLDLIGAFINKSTSQGLGSAYVHDHSWIAWKDSLDQFADEAHWKGVLQKVNRAKKLNDAQKRTRRLFQQTMQRWARGLQDDNPRKFEDPFAEDSEAA